MEHYGIITLATFATFAIFALTSIAITISNISLVNPLGLVLFPIATFSIFLPVIMKYDRTIYNATDSNITVTISLMGTSNAASSANDTISLGVQYYGLASSNSSITGSYNNGSSSGSGGSGAGGGSIYPRDRGQ